MNKLLTKLWPSVGAGVVAVVLCTGCSTMGGERSAGTQVKLTGDQEVPAVKTSGSGNGTIVVAADKSVSGSIKTTGVNGTVAHIHDSTPGQMCGAKNGPVIIP